MAWLNESIIIKERTWIVLLYKLFLKLNHHRKVKDNAFTLFSFYKFNFLKFWLNFISMHSLLTINNQNLKPYKLNL